MVDEQTSLERFMDMSIDLLAILELDTTILELSRSWERSFGWPPEELVGTSFLDLFHPDDLPQLLEELARLLEGRDALSVVVRVRARDGSYRWVQGNARSDLEAGRIFVTGADISERKALEEALQQQLVLEELVASIASRLIGAEPAHVVSAIERGVSELAQALGADRGHFLRGRRRRPDEATYVEWRNPDTAQEVHTPTPDTDVQRWWQEALSNERLLRFDDVDDLADEAPHVVKALRADGVRSLLHVPLPRHRGHWGFVTMVGVRRAVRFSDATTALLRLAGECFMTALTQCDDDAALQDARAELEHRNLDLERSNEELERFAYAAAHDLKAPLSRVEMALAAGAGGSGPAPELLDIARRGATRMRQLIEDLLAFSAIGKSTGVVVPVDLDELLDQALADLDRAIEEAGTTIERSPLPGVRGHPALLGQLLQNLLANAVKFRRRDAAPVVRVSGAREEGGIKVVVADNGIGVAPEHRSEVFGVFTRLNHDDASPGSGIGLATCAKVVHHHGGRISLEDGIDGGAAVHVWLPDAPVA